jgi:hypothetical protein
MLFATVSDFISAQSEASALYQLRIKLSGIQLSNSQHYGHTCIKFCVKTRKIIGETRKNITKSEIGEETLSPAEHLTGFLEGRGNAKSARDNPHLTIITAHWGHNSSCS